MELLVRDKHDRRKSAVHIDRLSSWGVCFRQATNIVATVIVKSDIEMIMRGRIIMVFLLVLSGVDAAAPVAIAEAIRVTEAIIVAVGLGPADDNYVSWSTFCKACAKRLDWNVGVIFPTVVDA